MSDEVSKMLEESQQKTVRLIDKFLNQLEGLYMNDSFSDVVFIVQTERIHANRAILAARCEYFRAMLFSGLAETHQREIELDVGLEPFKALLKFFYTGSISLNKDADKCGSVLDIFELARFYDIEDLVTEIYDFFTENLRIDNACGILNFAVLHKVDDLREECLKFLKGTAAEFTRHKSFKTLSKESLEVLLESESFSIPEVDMFRAVVDWRENNLSVETESIFSKIRLSSMKEEDIVRVVQPTNSFSVDEMLAPLSKRLLSKSVPHSAAHAVGSVDGINQPVKSWCAILNSVHLELMNEVLVNHVRFTILHDTALHYVVEVSMDNLEWERVIDYRRYPCTSLQCIYFEAHKFRYMKIVADKNVELQIHGLFQVRDMPRIVEGVVAPTEDVFTSQKELQLGLNPLMELDLDGDSYYGTIAFSQPIYISSVRPCFLCNKIAICSIAMSSEDKNYYTCRFGRFREVLKQFTFSPRAVSRIKIRVWAQAHADFSKVRIQCPAQPVASEAFVEPASDTVPP